MGAKAWFAAYYNLDPKVTLANKPELDREACVSLAKKMLPGLTLTEKEDGSLDYLNPRPREVLVGVYGDLKVIAHEDLGGDYPSQIKEQWRDAKLGATTYVHATHSVVDWFACALWQGGELVRALSVSPDSGVQEDIGTKFSFEIPYWDGSHALEDEFEDEFEDDEPYPLPFHPLELAEEALLAMLGFQFEGHPDNWVCDPMEIPIMKFEISKRAWWKFW